MAVEQHFQKMWDTAAYNTNAWNDSGVTGYGIKLKSGDRQFGLLVATDDNATALAQNWYSAIFGHDIVGAYTVSSNVSRFGVCGELHCAVSATTGGNLAGVFAYAELATTKTVLNNGDASFSGLLAGLDVPLGAVIAAGTTASCIAMGGNFGGTHTGKLAGFHITNPSAGSYDYLLQLGNGRGADGTGISTTISVSNLNELTTGLKIRVGTTEMEIVCLT